MDFQILFVFKVGHTVQKRVKPLFNRTHHWRCYVDSWHPGYPLSAFVKKVTFNLHETFDNPRQVVRQPPFAIEEDGFGNFQLQIEVAFLDCVTTFHYDLTLFDNNALHAYRTVRMEPTLEDWDVLVRLGGIVIPRDNNPSDLHRVLQTIQSSSNLELLHPYSFFPHLESRTETEFQSPSTPSTDSTVDHHSGNGSGSSVVGPSQSYDQSRCQDYRCDPYSHSHDRVVSKADLNTPDSALLQKPLPQKHKKKLQLLHEAQLLLEDAQKQQSQWASRPPGHSDANSPEYNLMPLSPNIPNWPIKPSPTKSSVRPFSSIEGHSGDVYSVRSPLVSDIPSKLKISTNDGRLQDAKPGPKNESQFSPVKRIVLKLSRRGSGNELKISSPRSKSLSESDERRERRRRKKERRNRHQKGSMENVEQRNPTPVTVSPNAASPTATASPTVATPPVHLKTTGSSIERTRHPHSLRPGMRKLEKSMAEEERGTTNNPTSFQSRDNQDVSPVASVASDGPHDHPCPSSVTTRNDYHRSICSSVERELFGSDDEIPATSGQTGQLSQQSSHQSLEKYANRSHLLLESMDYDFDEGLSRSLFSQGQESTVAGSPSVDLFGDEERPPSDDKTLENDDHSLAPGSSTSSDDSKPYDPSDPVEYNITAVCRDFSESHPPADASTPHCGITKADPLSASFNKLSAQEVRVKPSETHPSKIEADRKDPVGTPKTVAPLEDLNRKKEKKRRKHQSDGSDTNSSLVVLSSHVLTPPTAVSSASVLDVASARQSKADSHRTADPSESVVTGSNTESPAAMKRVQPVGLKSDNVAPAHSGKQKSQDVIERTVRSPTKGKTTHSKTKKVRCLEEPIVRKAKDTPQLMALPHKSKSQPKSKSAAVTSASVVKHSSGHDCRDTFSKSLKEKDVDLSSLSSLDSSTSSSSTPPMFSSCNSVVTSSAENKELTSSKSHRSPKLVVNSKLSKQPDRKATHRKKTRVTKVGSTDPSTDVATHLSQSTSLIAKIDDLPNDKLPSTEINDSQPIPVTREPSKYSNQQLEHLFDRLLRLRQPHLAIRMSEILLKHSGPTSPKATKNKKSTTCVPEGAATKGNRAVKILNKDEPRVIAFSLRRLPVACLDQLTALITEDESVPEKKIFSSTQ